MGAEPVVSEPAHLVKLLLLRHGRVANHRGDVPLTEEGTAQADAAGRWFAANEIDVAALLSGETRRAKDTADAFAAGYRSVSVEREIPDSVVSHALRNPDLYLGGQRVNMGEGAAMLAAQVPGVTEEDVVAEPFFAGFLEAADRIGYWLESGNVPGDDAHTVGRRIDAFARSLADVPGWRGRTVVAVTHSPVLRAVRLHHHAIYSREPPFLHGFSLTVARDGGLALHPFSTDTGDIPATSSPGH